MDPAHQSDGAAEPCIPLLVKVRHSDMGGNLIDPPEMENSKTSPHYGKGQFDPQCRNEGRHQKDSQGNANGCANERPFQHGPGKGLPPGQYKNGGAGHPDRLNREAEIPSQFGRLVKQQHKNGKPHRPSTHRSGTGGVASRRHRHRHGPVFPGESPEILTDLPARARLHRIGRARAARSRDGVWESVEWTCINE